jgi:hypothetical protein
MRDDAGRFSKQPVKITFRKSVGRELGAPVAFARSRKITGARHLTCLAVAVLSAAFAAASGNPLNNSTLFLLALAAIGVYVYIATRKAVFYENAVFVSSWCGFSRKFYYLDEIDRLEAYQALRAFGAKKGKPVAIGYRIVKKGRPIAQFDERYFIGLSQIESVYSKENKNVATVSP